MGICGGYQMLGRMIHDPAGSEGIAGSANGLGLLDVETSLEGDKTLKNVTGTLAPNGAAFTGYEIHIGKSTGADTQNPAAYIDGQPQGAISPDGRIMGLYVHGLFDEAEARQALLPELAGQIAAIDQSQRIDQALDRIAEALENHLDIETLTKIAGL